MKDFKLYRPTDFLQDEGFVDWLKNPKTKNANSDFWNKWLKENPEKENDVVKAKTLLEAITEPVHIEKEKENAIWNKIHNSVIVELQTKLKKLDTKNRTLKLNFIKIAASIILLIGLAGASVYFINQYNYSNQVITVENQRSTPSTVLMADGSSVVLYPKTTISYPKKFTRDFREIRIDGKAFFEVAKNSEQPFLIESNQLFTKVLGTSFIVEDLNEENSASISVVEGTVSVYTGDEKMSLIKSSEVKGEIVSGREALVFERQNKKFIRKDYKDNIYSTFNFVDTPVLHVFDLFEQYYGVKVLVDKDVLSSCSINASLIGMPFQKKVELICKAINYEYKIENNTVVLEGNGCQ